MSDYEFKLKKGDMLWVELKGPDQNYGYGEVEEVWFEESTKEECFGFYCLVNGGYRMGEESKIIEKPNARMTAKLLQSRKDYSEALKEMK